VLVRAGVEIPFGFLHVLWLDLVVVAPLALMATRRLPLAAAGVALAGVGLYASFVEPGRLVVERARLPLAAERAGGKPLRLGVISDLQFSRLGDHEREAVDRLAAERPDVIVIAGDFHQGSTASFERELPRLRALLRRLRAPGGVYAVQGDAESPAQLRRVVAGTGIRLLDAELARSRVRGRRLTIGGVALDYDSPDARSLARRLEEAPGRGDIRLLLAHRPDVVYQLRPRTRVDLVVAGHTHGGQLQLPLVGPPMIASRVPREVGAGGLHELNGRSLYVSRGVGVERGQAPKLRLGAPPEVALITLTSPPPGR
jgi:predicted MPP superfamily phosphohydrolase